MILEAEQVSVLSYYKRIRDFRREAGKESRSCPAKGFFAKDLACGHHLDHIRCQSAKFKDLLLQGLRGCSTEKRNQIVTDYDLGMQHVLYVVTLKLATYQQLPLLMSGCANMDLAKVRACAKEIRRQFQGVQSHDRRAAHDPLAWKLLRPGVAFVVQMDRFANGESLDVLPEFS